MVCGLWFAVAAWRVSGIPEWVFILMMVCGAVIAVTGLLGVYAWRGAGNKTMLGAYWVILSILVVAGIAMLVGAFLNTGGVNSFVDDNCPRHLPPLSPAPCPRSPVPRFITAYAYACACVCGVQHSEYH